MIDHFENKIIYIYIYIMKYPIKYSIGGATLLDVPGVLKNEVFNFNSIMEIYNTCYGKSKTCSQVNWKNMFAS
jgi:hypothetical protein